MPQRGDKLYSVSNGELKTVTFLQEQLLEGASLPTYTIVHAEDGRKYVTSVDMYLPTPLEAWRRYLDQCKEALAAQVKATVAALVQTRYCRAELMKSRQTVRKLLSAASSRSTACPPNTSASTNS